MKSSDLLNRRNEVEKILRSATSLLLEGYSANPGADTQRAARLNATAKSSFRDIVTEYDKKVELYLTEMLQKSFPGESIVGEEDTATHSGSIRDRCQDLSGFWIIDPIDGTTNFSRAYPFFCSTIAFVAKNEQGIFEPQVGVTFDPVHGEVFAASKGGGAWLGREKMSVTSIAEPKEALLTTGFARERHKSEDIPFELFKKLTKLTLGVRRDGAAALDLAYVACGRTDAYWESGLAPWDTAAGILLIQEAGGRVTHLDGQPYDIFSGEVLATNSFLHKWVQENLKIG